MEQDSERTEHLSLERISALLDEPGADPTAAEHLERCERCEREHERMRRMRMALSALGDVEPPADQWQEIEARLPERGEGARSTLDEDDDVFPLFRSGWVAQVAAATLVFAVGLSAGLQLRDDGSSGPSGEETPAVTESASGPGAAAGPSRLASSDRAGPAGMQRAGAYVNAARSLEAMVGDRSDDAVEPIDDPVGAAEELARLDALAEAAREALRDRPADPTLNNFLFRVNERQEELSSRLGAAARLTSLDYR